MNITDRITTSTRFEEQTWRDLDDAIEDLRRAQNRVRDRIDAARLAARPILPMASHFSGLIEAAGRFKEGTPSTSHHGDPVGDKDEPQAVVYATQTGDHGEPMGWIHVRHCAPMSFKGSGGYIWTFTDEEIAILLAYLEDLGVSVTEHWKSDGGVSIRFGKKVTAPLPPGRPVA